MPNKVNKLNVRCPTRKCVEAIGKYGEHYHSVWPVDIAPAFMPDAKAECTHCGGLWNGHEWKHVCKFCNAEVSPGELRGINVPHRCPSCDAKLIKAQMAKGLICRKCGATHAYCCC